jgi:hypothetical protein
MNRAEQQRREEQETRARVSELRQIIAQGSWAAERLRELRARCAHRFEPRAWPDGVGQCAVCGAIKIDDLKVRLSFFPFAGPQPPPGTGRSAR